jgi:GNAT superfamily N-acetyltransferase
MSDAKNYQDELLAVTYLLLDADNIVAFFSLLNDRISISDVDSNRKWAKYFRDIMPQGKRFKSYPAMKIGRLAVSENYKGLGIGTMIIDYLKQLFISNNRTGCKYITVDAYRQSLSFYEKNGFNYLIESDKANLTRLMYFDLILMKQ